MKISEFLTSLRRSLDDVNEPYLWPDIELAGYADEGMNRLCVDTLCLKDSATVGEVLAAGSIVLSGLSGQVDSVKVNGVSIISGPVAFNADLPTTASDLAAAIGVKGLYSADASAGDGSIALSAIPGTGSNPNGYAVSVVCSGGMSATTTPLSGGTSICRMFFLPGVDTYALDPRVIAVDRIKPSGRVPMTKTSRSVLDSVNPLWEDSAPGSPSMFMVESRSIQVAPAPKDAETVKVTVFRRPLVPAVSAGSVNMDLGMELDDDYMEGVGYWCRYRAYSKKDAETNNQIESTGNLALYDRFVSKKISDLKGSRDVARVSAAHPGLT